VERGTFPFAGRRGDDRAALCGERCGFSGLAEGMRPCEGDLSYERGVEGWSGGCREEGLWALVGEGAAGAGAGGRGGEGAAATYGGGRAAQPATRPYLGGLADGAAGIAIFV
jgi:hypothetical protein